jgi:hypothetical protein
LVSARKNAESLEQRRAYAMVIIEGLRELNRRANKQKSDGLNVCEAMVPTADAAVLELIEIHCEEYERAISREDVATSPYRTNGPIAKLRKIQAERGASTKYQQEQLKLFGNVKENKY